MFKPNAAKCHAKELAFTSICSLFSHRLRYNLLSNFAFFLDNGVLIFLEYAFIGSLLLQKMSEVTDAYLHGYMHIIAGCSLFHCCLR